MKEKRETIANRAVLVTLGVSYFRGRRRDIRAGKVVSDHYGSDPRRGRVIKDLLKDAIAPINTLYNQVYAYHKQITKPWGAGTTRILKSSAIMEYQSQMRAYKAQFWALSENLFARYGEFIEAEAEHLGSMFRIEDYPSLSVLREKFDFTVDIDPLPEPGKDWRLDMSDDMIAQLQAEFEESSHRRVVEAMTDTWESLHQRLSEVADILGKGNKKAIKAQTFTSLSKMASLLTQLNITDDPQLEEMRQRLESLFCARDPETQAEIMKESDTDRDSALTELNSMMKSMEGWMS